MSSTKEDKKVECVGSLLVHQTDMKELTERSKGAGAPLVHSTDYTRKGEQVKESNQASPSLVRRITEKLKKPLTDEEMEEMEDWTCFD